MSRNTTHTPSSYYLLKERGVNAQPSQRKSATVARFAPFARNASGVRGGDGFLKPQPPRGARNRKPSKRRVQRRRGRLPTLKKNRATLGRRVRRRKRAAPPATNGGSARRKIRRKAKRPVKRKTPKRRSRGSGVRVTAAARARRLSRVGRTRRRGVSRGRGTPVGLL